MASKIIERDIIGQGLTIPVRRLSGRDFVSGSGEAAVRSSVSQILGTRRGELPWKPSFGTYLERFRHKNATRFLVQDIIDECTEAISLWEPRVLIRDCSAGVDGNTITVNVTWFILADEQSATSAIVGPITQEETL